MTDEEEENQKKILGVSKNTRKEEHHSITSRINIAQRLQRPKLLSDMSSFKAANHGAVFEDFVRWYGNPENPLSEEVNGETARRALENRSKLPPDEAKSLALEEASEAIAILMSLRAFWEDTWEEAEPLPAFDQEPLFNPYTTVEMVLHSFETIHPALLLNQVMAVTLTNAKFVLESAAGPARKIRSVALRLIKFHRSIDAALEMLSSDAAEGFLQLSPTTLTEEVRSLSFVSTSTIIKCEDVCNEIGELEQLLSRALPLMQTLPGEYKLVDALLQCEDERYHFVSCPSERCALLKAIKYQQTKSSDSPSEATPAIREYVLRTIDSKHPCQLSAKLVPSPSFVGAPSAALFHGSLLLAITKSSHT
jgi:Rab3 GTPase-activating protein catalytic subunit